MRGAPAAALARALPSLRRPVERAALLESSPPGERAALAGTLAALARRGIVVDATGAEPGAPRAPVLVLGGGPGAESAHHLVSEAGLAVTRGSNEEDHDALVRAMGESAAAAFFPTSPADPGHALVNRAALASGTPWVRAFSCQQLAVVGPAVVPYKTACFACYAERARAAAAGDPIVAALRESMPGEEELRAYCASAAPVQQIATSMAVLEALRLAADPASSITRGAIWILDASTAESTVERILRDPRCRACGR
jgi:oxazoline/thiazoline synthase